MPWYKSGTVSVTQNSNAVIGSGTAFLANSRVGDAFRGPDGAWYEVINIASDTAMAIAPNYQGATNTAGVYALAPMQGYVKDSADALRALVGAYGAKLAALGTTGNYEVLPVIKGGTGGANLTEAKANLGILEVQSVARGGTGATDAAGARTALGVAKAGANGDITALTALTTALTVAQGGTGGATQASARAGLGLGSAAVAPITGTVSQSGGFPTGAIIESGSNSIGTYTKFADGTMIATIFNSGPWSVIANTLTVLGPFGTPAAFTGTNYSVSAQAAPSATNDTYGVVASYPVSATSCSFVFRNGATSQNLSNIKITCIGRWY